MKKKPKPKALNVTTKLSCIHTEVVPHGFSVTAFLSNDDAHIMKLIYWLIEYRIWQCETYPQKPKKNVENGDKKPAKTRKNK